MTVPQINGIDKTAITTVWLDRFAKAVSEADLQATLSVFLPEGWLRDVLIFTWNNRSLAGRERISAYLANTLATARVSNVKLDEHPLLKPDYFSATPATSGITVAFTFETPIAYGRGFAYLLFEKASANWKALSVLTMMSDLKGHEEVGPEAGIYGGHTVSWEEISAERRARIESDPHVIIVGAGQTGLNIAARFQQMNIPAIVVERFPHVGDTWRKRYPTLSLHTTRTHHTMLYQGYPRNWPTYTPRDKVANWLEQYVESQDVIVWTNSYIVPVPKYDHNSQKWEVVVNRNGTEVNLRPVHIVLAISAFGSPFVPSVGDRELFAGTTMHASEYMGGVAFAGKNAVVIGAGNTSADICQDLSFRGAASVTMVQRSSTCVISSNTVAEAMARAFPDGVPLEISDFKFHSMPLKLQKQLSRSREQLYWEKERELHEGLRKGGLHLNMGRDGSGQHFLIFERFGGFWIDVGVSDLISSGKVQVKQGTEAERFTKSSVVFKDGTELDADVVVFATGYVSSRGQLKDIFGEEVINKTKEIWGMDEEGELNGCYRPSGHPGLWYAAGDFSHSRFSSKQLALEIKAIELGLMPSS